MNTDIERVHKLSDFSLEQLEQLCKSFLRDRFSSAIVDVLLASDVNQYYAVNSE